MRPQLQQFNGDCVVLVAKDNRQITAGAKCNLLIDEAVMIGATHRAFIDDDDMVTDDYVSLNMEGVYKGYDCNTLVGLYYVNGNYDRPFYHSLQYTHWWEDANGYYRNPNHLNVVSLDKTKHIRFQDKSFGEDGCWSEDLHREQVLKSEYVIYKPFYLYLMRTKQNGI